MRGRDRIGGRIWSDRSLGASVDLGATWIHGPDGNPIANLAAKAGLPTVKTENDAIIRGRNGRRIWQLFSPSWLNEVVEQTSVGAEYEKLNLKELETAFETYGLGYEGPDVKFPNGYDQIFEPLSGGYQVGLNETVGRIAQSTSGVAISVGDDVVGRFDAVIVTVPLGVLKKGVIAFDPPLPAAKKQAIDRMGMGVLDKLYLLFDDVFWDADKTTILTPLNDLPRGQFNYWINFHKYLGVPIIAAFNAAGPAYDLSQKTDDEIVSRALKALGAAYPE